MKCPRCRTEMVPGKAIDTEPEHVFTIVPRPNIDHKTLKIVDCLKCPICGHSDDNKPTGNSL